MFGSYDTLKPGVLGLPTYLAILERRLSAAVPRPSGPWLAILVAALLAWPVAWSAAQMPVGGHAGDAAVASGAGQKPETAEPILLQMRIYNGPDEVTTGARLQLYPRGQRTAPIPTALSADRAYEARVAPGFYDIQAIREHEGQVSGIRWLEQLLVQRYPDEYGRHLQVVNFRADFGALQVRPAPAEASAARGWSGAVFPVGDETRELARARLVGEDLLVVIAAGRYDVRVTLGDRTVHWLREVEIPADGTRLKTWSATTP